MSKRSIAVLDGNSLLHRAFHALPETMTAPDGRPTNAAFGFVSMLVRLLDDMRPDAVVVAFDAGKPAFRMEALAQYKIQRPPTHDSLRVQFPMVKKLIEAMGIPIVELDGWEGDDILGTLARRGEADGYKMLLVTGDRDAFQLVSDDIKVVTTRKGVTDIAVMGPDEVEERYGVTPAQIPDYLGLKGDTSDNIPGVPGVGEKTAAKLLQQYATLDRVLEAAEKGEIPGKVGQNLVEHASAAVASRIVATIVCDVPVELDLATIEFGQYEPAVLATAFGELRFTSLLERFLALHTKAAAGAVAVEPERGGRAAAENAAAARGGDSADGGERPGSGGAPTTGGAPVRARAVRRLVTGADALAAVRTWVAAPADGPWLGVAFGTAGATLFAGDPPLAVSSLDSNAVVDAEDAREALEILVRSGRVAAADAKALLQHLCPPDESIACRAEAWHVTSERLFDVAVAAYLLESSRSSYEVGALSADYLGAPLEEATEERPDAAILAESVADLAAELERLLAEDASIDVYRGIETPLVPVLLGMERVGVGLDATVLAALAEETRAGIDSLRREIFELAGTEFVVDSPKQLGEVLFEKLGLPPQKKTKTGYSTDASVLQALAPMHPIAEKIVAYRELTKLTSTYIDALPRMLGGDGRLHTSFNQTVAATGRLSSSNPNLQNIPVRTELGRRIRAAFVPAEAGDVMVSADYSQIELRILAHLSEDQGLIEAFTSGMDFHQATAARVFGVEPGAVESGMRVRAKAVNFGIVYGQSAHGLAETLKIERAEAQAMIDRYYAAYPGVRRFLDETVAAAHRDGFATTMFGRKRRIPELRSSNFNLRSFGERTAMNHPMQGSAADIMKLAMIEVDRRLRAEGFRSRMVLQVHDELVFEAPVGEVESLAAMVCDAMGGVVELAVPLEVSVGSGSDWSSAK